MTSILYLGFFGLSYLKVNYYLSDVSEQSGRLPN